MERGTGLTTKQMKRAKTNAVFIWPTSSSLWYPKKLAAKLGRGDLKIVTPSWLDSESCRARMFSEIIVDHATRLSSKQYDVLDRLLEKLAR